MTSLRMYLVDFVNSGFRMAWISFEWDAGGCSLRISWSCTKKCDT